MRLVLNVVILAVLFVNVRTDGAKKRQVTQLIALPGPLQTTNNKFTNYGYSSGYGYGGYGSPAVYTIPSNAVPVTLVSAGQASGAQASAGGAIQPTFYLQSAGVPLSSQGLAANRYQFGTPAYLIQSAPYTSYASAAPAYFTYGSDYSIGNGQLYGIAGQGNLGGSSLYTSGLTSYRTQESSTADRTAYEAAQEVAAQHASEEAARLAEKQASLRIAQEAAERQAAAQQAAQQAAAQRAAQQAAAQHAAQQAAAQRAAQEAAARRAAQRIAEEAAARQAAQQAAAAQQVAAQQAAEQAALAQQAAEQAAAAQRAADQAAAQQAAQQAAAAQRAAEQATAQRIAQEAANQRAAQAAAAQRAAEQATAQRIAQEAANQRAAQAAAAQQAAAQRAAEQATAQRIAQEAANQRAAQEAAQRAAAAQYAAAQKASTQYLTSHQNTGNLGSQYNTFGLQTIAGNTGSLNSYQDSGSYNGASYNQFGSSGYDSGLSNRFGSYDSSYGTYYGGLGNGYKTSGNTGYGAGYGGSYSDRYGSFYGGPYAGYSGGVTYLHTGSGSAGFQNSAANAYTLRQYQDLGYDGSFQYSFETDNGINVHAVGSLKNAGTEDEIQVITGSYSYITPDGQHHTVHYIADENGFHARGEDLPLLKKRSLPKDLLDVIKSEVEKHEHK